MQLSIFIKRALLSLVSFFSSFFAVSLGADDGETYRLALDPGITTFHIETSIGIRGNMGESGAKALSIPFRVAAKSAYQEMLLRPDRENLAIVSRRRYADATSSIDAPKAEMVRLRESRRRILCMWDGIRFNLFSNDGPLTRQELELLDTPLNLPVVIRLLPDERVKIGDAWTHSDEVLGQFLQLHRITENDLSSRVTSVEKQVAKIALEGKMAGEVAGAESKMEVDGEYWYDLRRNMIAWLQMTVSETRDPSDVTPRYQATIEARMRIRPADGASEFSDSLPEHSTRDSLQDLEFTSTHGGYRLVHGRDWHLIGDHPVAAVMRLVDHGELIAQCNLSPLRDLPAGKQVGLDQFADEVRDSIEFGQITESEGFADTQGRDILKVVVAGEAEGISVRRIYYHLSNSDGRRVALLFTLKEDLAERFEQHDWRLIRGIELIAQPKAGPESKSAAKSTSRTIQ